MMTVVITLPLQFDPTRLLMTACTTFLLLLSSNNVASSRMSTASRQISALAMTMHYVCPQLSLTPLAPIRVPNLSGKVMTKA